MVWNFASNLIPQSKRSREWILISVGACISAYGAWLYLQPGRKLPPLRSTFVCEFVDPEVVLGDNNFSEYTAISTTPEFGHSTAKDPLCSNIVNYYGESTCAKQCFSLIDTSHKSSIVSSNLFTIDGLCGILIFVHPKIAYANKPLVLDIAEISRGKNVISPTSTRATFIV